MCGLEPGRVVKPKMTAARADTLYYDKDLWQYLRRKCSKVIFITFRICSAS